MYQTSYHRPKSVAEAAKLFSSSGDAAYISGGHTLLPTMKARLAAPKNLIDLRHVPELKGIQVSADAVTIGAATPHAGVAGSAEVKKADSDACRPRRIDRRSAGPSHGHHRRLGGEQ